MNDKVIGIIGGMGPEATASCYMKIIKATRVKRDQEHFRVVIDSNPKIPDRTEAILGFGESPVNAIVQTGKNLERLGIDVACIPCITSHYFLEDIQKQLSFPILNALEEVRKYIKEHYPGVTKIGVMATTGTIRTGLFEKYLSDFIIIYPDATSQNEKVMEAIYGERGIKRGNTGEEPLGLLKEASNELIEQGAEVLISGCTEIELVLKPHHLPQPLIDPMEVMANAIVKYQEQYVEHL